MSKVRRSRFKKLLRVVGPGFITGASDDDPSGILTYTQTGAAFGLTQLWTAVLALPFMIVMQEMCGRIGMVTGKGIADVIRHHYGRAVLLWAVALLFVANTVNIGADLGAMASSAELIFGLPFWGWLTVMALVTLLLEIFIPYPMYARYLKWLTLSLFAYIIVVFMVVDDWGAALIAAVTPSFSWDRAFLMNIVAVFGTTISPYLFFWQADEEVEEEVEHHKLKAMGVGKPAVHPRDIRAMRLDTGIGMVFSNMIAFFIILTAASTLGRAGLTTIETAADAAAALAPLGGHLAEILFAAGIIGTGLLAVPVLAGSASYAVAESLHWKEGLSKKWWQAKGFYGVIVASTMIGMLLNAAGIPPFRMLYYTAVLNGVVSPFLMMFILLISGDGQIKRKYRNGRLSTVLGWVITVFMGGCAVMVVVG